MQRETCPDCGTRGDDWQGPDGRPDAQALVAEETVCLGCRAIRKAGHQIDSEDADGVRIRLVPHTDS